MKRKILIIIVAVIAFVLIGILVSQLFSKVFENPVIASLPKCDGSDCYYSDGFQDYTNYCKYYYSKQNNIVEAIKNNQYFKPVTSDGIVELNSYFDNFEGWLAYVDYKEQYDFQKSNIDMLDYFYIENKDTCEKYAGYHDKYSAYNVYFFDTQTKTLFLIHSNI